MQTYRLLSIILILMSKGTVTGKELAEHFEVSIRTIYRDIDKISSTVIPIASIGGKGGGFYILDNYKLDRMFFSKKEIQPILSVMKSLKDMLGKNESFNNSIAKFESLYNSEDKNSSFQIDVSDNGADKRTAEYIDLINNAIECSKCVVFTYINRRLESEERIAEPIQLYFLGGNWYFNAFCKIRNDYRRFKVVRVRDLRLGESFVKRDIHQDNLEKIFQDSFQNRSIEVILSFSKRMANQLKEFFSEDKITMNPDGSAIVKFVSPDEEGLKKYVLSFGIDCIVLKPDHLRNEMKDYIEKLYISYNSETYS